MRRPLSREVFIPFAVHRFGTRDTAPLDNFSKGGLSCAIDVILGDSAQVLCTRTRTNLTLSWHRSHPETGQTIEGVVIPHWQKLLEAVTQLMDIFPDLEFVGWDMLPIKDGWCVIEGNAYMDIDLLQAHGGMLADDRVKEIFRVPLPLEHHCGSAQLRRQRVLRCCCCEHVVIDSSRSQCYSQHEDERHQRIIEVSSGENVGCPKEEVGCSKEKYIVGRTCG